VEREDGMERWEGARGRKDKRDGEEEKGGGEERGREGDTRHTNPSLLSALPKSISILRGHFDRGGKRGGKERKGGEK